MKDIYFVQSIDNSRLARVADPRRKREQQWMIATVALVFLLLFGYAWQNYEMVRLGYQIEEVRQKQAGLADWNRALRLEEATLRNPNRIYQVAERDLHLESIRPGQIVRLGDDAVIDRGAVLADAQVGVRASGVLRLDSAATPR